MSETTITERQQYWLDQIRAADAFEGSVADYARDNADPAERREPGVAKWCAAGEVAFQMALVNADRCGAIERTGDQLAA